ELPADRGAVGHEPGRPGDLDRADFGADILAVQLDAPGREAHAQPRDQLAQGRFARKVHAPTERREGHGTVHGPGVEEPPAQPAGQPPGDGALAGPRRAVDRDDAMHEDPRGSGGDQRAGPAIRRGTGPGRGCYRLCQGQWTTAREGALPVARWPTSV